MPERMRVHVGVYVHKGLKEGEGIYCYIQYVITYQMKQEGCINQR